MNESDFNNGSRRVSSGSGGGGGGQFNNLLGHLTQSTIISLFVVVLLVFLFFSSVYLVFRIDSLQKQVRKQTFGERICNSCLCASQVESRYGPPHDQEGTDSHLADQSFLRYVTSGDWGHQRHVERPDGVEAEKMQKVLDSNVDQIQEVCS